MAALTKKQIVQYLSSRSITEMTSLVRELEDRWGVRAAPTETSVALYAAYGAPFPDDDTPTEFNVVLKGVGAKKIQVIKALREVVAGLGLTDAKALVESAPTPIKEGVDKEEAELVAAKIREAGGEAEIAPAG
ncbi:MAG: 50S ribosomal protein L7/L12 [Deltaproteobacteria bacterium]|jgi:large subunit ribosomal protein L7/L12|nr:50S ribosomal protein L7/L12 [Deltaproteobacteria bacterium]MBW2531687.1 50S ribosomal protein L7/L12 [Deltaproteobacteria bacterium]